MTECGWSWERCLATPSLVAAAAWHHLPTKYLRQAWPLAQLEAMFGNANGGKAERGKGTDPSKLFQPIERLPWYARPPGFELPQPMLLPHHCAALVTAIEAEQLQNCSWVLQVIGIADDVHRVLESGKKWLEEEEINF